MSQNLKERVAYLEKELSDQKRKTEFYKLKAVMPVFSGFRGDSEVFYCDKFNEVVGENNVLTSEIRHLLNIIDKLINPQVVALERQQPQR